MEEGCKLLKKSLEYSNVFGDIFKTTFWTKTYMISVRFPAIYQCIGHNSLAINLKLTDWRVFKHMGGHTSKFTKIISVFISHSLFLCVCMCVLFSAKTKAEDHDQWIKLYSHSNDIRMLLTLQLLPLTLHIVSWCCWQDAGLITVE